MPSRGMSDKGPGLLDPWDYIHDVRAAERSPLLANVLLFRRLLTELGAQQPMDATTDVVRALMLIDLGNREDFKNALRCLLVGRHEDLSIFEDAFERFWQVKINAPQRSFSDADSCNLNDMSTVESAFPSVTLPTELATQFASGESTDSGGKEGETRLGLYSREEVLCAKDFGMMSDEELWEAAHLLRRLDWTFTERRSRRLRHGKDGAQLDIRRTLRAGMSHGGELFDLKLREPRTKRRPLILICDISGSMDRYARVLLHFLHSLEQSRARTEVFVFATRLTRITASLRHLDPEAAVAAVVDNVQDWSGGTRIGESLRAFNRHWSRRVLTQGALVLLISDGWDRGNPDLLAAEMCRLQRASYRTMWLNPLLGSVEYRPLTQGLQAALPYVDDFLPAHNISSLVHLAEHLGRVQAKRPPRGSGVARP